MSKRTLPAALQSLFMAGLAAGLINFGSQVFFARSLPLHTIGIYGQIATVIGLISIFTSFGWNQSVIGLGFTEGRFAALILLTGAQLLIVLGIFLIAALFAHVLGYEAIGVTLWPSLMMILGGLLLLPAHVLNCPAECEMGYQKLALARVCASFFSNLSAVILVLVDPSIYALATRDLMAGLIYLIISGFLVDKKYITGLRSLDLRLIMPILKYTKDIWLNNVLTEGSKRLDYALVAAILPRNEFAIYFQVRNIFEGVISLIAIPIRSAVFSFLSSRRNQLDAHRISIAVAGYTLGFGIVGGVLAYFVGPKLLVALLGAKWQEGTALIAPFFLTAALIIGLEVLVSIAKSLNEMRPVIVGRLVQFLVLSAAVGLLAYRYGMVGAGWGTTLGVLAAYIIVLTCRLNRAGGALRGRLARSQRDDC